MPRGTYDVMDLKSLWCFLTAARRSSLTKAGIDLDIAEAAVSQRIKSLETHLGAKLYQSRGGRFQLTAAGERTAQLAVSRGLAKLTRSTAVTVNSVLPGPTMSDGVEVMLKEIAKRSGQSVEEAGANFVKQHRPSSLLQRFAGVDEIASMVVYVASKEASATNGAALRAEGGIVNFIA